MRAPPTESTRARAGTRARTRRGDYEAVAAPGARRGVASSRYRVAPQQASSLTPDATTAAAAAASSPSTVVRHG